MESFEELELSPELVEALASEGIEVPTSLQTNAIPVLRRGGSVVLRAGPGSGSFATYGSALLDRIEAGGNHPRALVLSLTRDRSKSLALSLGRLALATGHRVSALGVPWAFPERADILFSTLDDLESGVRSSAVKVDQVGVLVLDGASALLDTESESLARILQGVNREGFQFVLVTDEVSLPVRDFVEQHAKRAVFLPAEAGSQEEEGSIQRGTLRVRTVEGEKVDALPGLLLELFEGGVAHALLFSHSEDRAADVGDFLTLHGFASGAPGDPEVPVWLGVDPLEVRATLREREGTGEGVTILSIDLPLDADELDRRHGGATSKGIVFAHPRELPHLRRTARTAGYTVELTSPAPNSSLDEASRFLAEIERTMAEEDLLPQLVLLEPLFQRAGAAEVAAALGCLIRKQARAARKTLPDHDVRSDAVSRPPAWARLFLSVGEKDGITTRDLLGAILGESGIAGDQVGRIDLRETFTKVEVQEPVADKVIRALNGTSIRGRSVRADFDRGETGGARREGGAPRSSGGPRSGPREGGGSSRGGRPEGGRGRPEGGAPRSSGGPRSGPREGGGSSRGGRPEGGRGRPEGGAPRSSDGPRSGPREGGGSSRGGRPEGGRGKDGPPFKSSRPSSGGSRGGAPFKKGKPESGGSGRPRRSDTPKPRRPE